MAGHQIAALIKEINTMVKQHMREAFKSRELTFPQILVLEILSESGRQKVSEISEKMSLANSTVSGIVDRLEMRDYVRRVRDNKDRRIVYVELTDHSKDLHDELKNEINQFLEEIVSEASKEDIDRILTGLETLKRLLKN